MQIRLNNVWEENRCGTLYDLLVQKSIAEKTGIAVALNGKVVPHSQWKTTALNTGDEILLIQATAGG